MTCEVARENLLLRAYGELPEAMAAPLERHIESCSRCAAELALVTEMEVMLTAHPMVEPDPNLVAQSRLRLDEALDLIPRHSWLARLGASAAAWLGHLQSAPALATLLLGVGFLGGNFTYRYQVAHQPKLPPTVVLTNADGGGVSSISGIKHLADDRVQVSYDRVVPEIVQGSLNDPQIRQLLKVGTQAATSNGVRVDSVSLLATECRSGFGCRESDDPNGIRATLVSSLRNDRNAGVRMKALEGLQPYVSQDERVRDAVAQALLADQSPQLRIRAIEMLEPVQSDASVRQVLRSVSTNDVNPYIRTVSTQALEGSSSIQ